MGTEEHTDYTGPTTQISFERPIKYQKPEVVTITVPFSEAEIATIAMARNIQEKWGVEGTRGSNWERELANIAFIPWAMALLNRENALDQIQRALTFFQRTQHTLSDRGIRPDLQAELAEVIALLRNFFPEG